MIARIWRALARAFVVLLCSASIASAAAVYTYGTLPGSPTAGQLAWITDGAGTESVGSPAAGGGSSMHLVAWDAGQSRWEFAAVGAPTSPPTADAATYLEGVQVSYDATISGLSAANVQAAIDELAATGAGAAHIVSDEGTPLTQRPELDFTGSGITCSDDAGGNATSCLVLAPIWTVVAALPGSPSNTEQTYVVIDGAALDDCDTGSGSLNVHCSWDGSGWQALGGGAGGGGAPTDAAYIVDVANGTLSAEVVVNNLATLNAWLGTSIADGAHTAAGAPTSATYWTTSANGSLSAEVVVSNLTQLNSALGSSIADGAHTSPDGVGVATVAGDSGTATGGTVTVAGGAGVATSATGTTVTVAADVEEVTGYVQPTNDGVGLRVRRSSDSAVVFSVDPDTGSVVCYGSPCTFTDSTGVLANTYSLAGARFYEVDPAVDTILNIQAAHTTTLGSCITIDVVNDLVELLCAGTYKISMAISAQFTATTGDECMKLIAWNETDNQLIPDGHGVLAASGRRTAASQATSLSNGGQYIITIASPIDVAVYTEACFTGTYPTTSIVGAPASSNGNAMSSIIVERVN